MKLNIVPARTGIQWVKLGVQTFFKQPLALAGLFFLYTMAMLMLLSVPVVGDAAVVLMPAATLGMMVATEEATRGRFPMPSVLLSAFRAGRQRVRAMLVLGLVYAALMLLIKFLAFALGADPATMVSEPKTAGGPQEVSPVFFLILALQLPFLILFTHAPALVHWHGVSPMKSLFFSAVAFWRNLGAFVVFGAGWMLFIALTGFLLAVIFALFGAAPSMPSVIPLALMIMAMVATSMYFTFRDSFQAGEDETPPQPQPGPPGGDDPA